MTKLESVEVVEKTGTKGGWTENVLELCQIHFTFFVGGSSISVVRYIMIGMRIECFLFAFAHNVEVAIECRFVSAGHA